MTLDRVRRLLEMLSQKKNNMTERNFDGSRLSGLLCYFDHDFHVQAGIEGTTDWPICISVADTVCTTGVFLF